jgi:hypothetical protein
VEITQIIKALKKPFGDPAVQAIVRELGIKKVPKAEPDEPEASLQAKPLGVELGFTDADYLARRKVARYGNADMILTGVTLYAAGGEPGFKTYSGALPKGVSVTDPREKAVEKLGPPKDVEEEDGVVYSQGWKMNGYFLTLVYASDGRPRYAQLIDVAYIERVSGSAN